MHGQLPCNLDEKLVDMEQSYQWLKILIVVETYFP